MDAFEAYVISRLKTAMLAHDEQCAIGRPRQGAPKGLSLAGVRSESCYGPARSTREHFREDIERVLRVLS